MNKVEDFEKNYAGCYVWSYNGVNYFTNGSGEGLFTERNSNYGPVHTQLLGTCQFWLPADEKKALRKVRRFHKTSNW